MSNQTKLFECLVIPSPSFSKHKTLVNEASVLAKKIILNDTGVRYDEGALLALLNNSNADAAIIGTDPLSANVISSLNHLKAIGKYGVGCDNVDVSALKSKGIHFGWEGGVNRRSVSELVLGFMLGHQRNIFRSIDRMGRGSWQKNGGVQLSEKTIGIVGFGFIGTDVAKLLQPFGCKLLVHDILDKSKECRELNAEQVSYEALLRSSDIVTFHVPGGTGTKEMFSAREVALVQNHALIINTARGSIVEFRDVTEAVKKSQIGAYASDVFPVEPLISTDYSIESGFYFSPHIGGNADEAILAMGRAAIRGLKDFWT